MGLAVVGRMLQNDLGVVLFPFSKNVGLMESNEAEAHSRSTSIFCFGFFFSSLL